MRARCESDGLFYFTASEHCVTIDAKSADYLL